MLRDHLGWQCKYLLWCTLVQAFRLLNWICLSLGVPRRSGDRLLRRRILLRHKFQEYVLSDGASDFCCVPPVSSSCLATVQDLLAMGRRASLYSIDSHFAYFVVAPTDIYECRRYPFFYLAQFQEATELIRMPLGAFFESADRLLSRADHPLSREGHGTKVALVFNTARCGSTLLCQVFNQWFNSQKCIAIAEPVILSNLIWLQSQGVLTEAQVRQCVRASMAWMMQTICCFPNPKGIKLVLLKVPPVEIQLAEAVYREFGNKLQYLFMYRDSRNSIVSRVKSIGNWTIISLWLDIHNNACTRILLSGSRWHSTLINFTCENVSTCGQSVRHYNPTEFMAHIHFKTLRIYNHLVENVKLPFVTFRYEELTERTEQVCAELYSACRWDFEDNAARFAKIARSALQLDSQINSPLSRENLARTNVTLDDAEVTRVIEVMSDSALGTDERGRTLVPSTIGFSD